MDHVIKNSSGGMTDITSVKIAVVLMEARALV